jgi:penicillin amidase
VVTKLDAGAEVEAEPTLEKRRPARVWRVLGRLARWTVVTVAVLTLILAGVVIWSIRRAFPETGGELALAGLTAPVTVYRDAYGVPQLYAETAEDLFRAQGYVQSQDRFWEMDVRRHVTAGRLSEMFGRDQVGTDAFLRTLGWRRVAEQEWDIISAETRRLLQAYADGVNAWIAQHGGSGGSGTMSLEYSVLGLMNRGYRVEPWTPIDSLAWLKAMAWDLRGNMEAELDRALLFARGLSRDQIAQLHPEYPYDLNRPIIAGGAVVDGAFDANATPPEPDLGEPTAAAAAWKAVAPALGSVAAVMDLLPRMLDRKDDAGSNSWVVSGKFTNTGKPLLANDPHLSASMPGIWYQMGLHCECEYNVEGFTFSGVPGVVIGHNSRIAWGLTNMDPDVTDLYLEKVDGNLVFDGTTWVGLDRREEVIKVAGGDPVTIVVRSSRHGPLISDRSADAFTIASRPPVDPAGSPLPQASPIPRATLDPATSGIPKQATASPYAVALRWTALDPGRTADALFAIDRANNWAELRAAATLFEVPAQNIVYADVDGNIGYQSPGKIPVRGKGDGRWPAPGWDPAYDWKGYIPAAELPTVYNPVEGWIVTANQAVVGPRYRHLLTHDWSYGYRSQRLMDLLRERTSRGTITAEDIRQLQFDNRNGFAPTLVAAVRTVPGLPAAADLLSTWDFQQPDSSAPAALYNAFWRNLLVRTFDELPADRRPSGNDRWWEVVRSLVDQPNSPWWDDHTTPTVETRDTVLGAAMHDAVAELTERLGDDPASWRWGDLHTLELVNGTFGESGVAPLEWLFNRGPAPVGGGPAIVNATSWVARDGYEVTAVPSMRMIADLSNWDASRWIQLSGNSGHAFHPHYDDQFELWRTGQNLPMRWDRNTIKTEAKDTLVLHVFT